MKIVGCDFHPGWQQVAVFDPETGEAEERKLLHGDGEAERFYRELEAPALVGIEACGNSQWFIELAEGLGHVVWVGDAAQIRASYVRRQKTDRRDARHILKLLIEQRFPRLWTPSVEQRDLRQLLIHRHKLVEIRTRVKNGLQHLALNRGLQKKSRLWSVRGRADLEKLPLAGWTARRREDLLGLLQELNRSVDELDEAVSRAAQAHPQARLLMTHPGVGAISKQGNRFMRQLLVEAAQTANRLDEGFRRQYTARCHHKAKGVAKVATARKLAVRLYWMLRQNVGYPEIALIESSPRVPLVGRGHTERLNGRSRIQQ